METLAASWKPMKLQFRNFWLQEGSLQIQATSYPGWSPSVFSEAWGRASSLTKPEAGAAEQLASWEEQPSTAPLSLMADLSLAPLWGWGRTGG